jgi:hypothetical protein
VFQVVVLSLVLRLLYVHIDTKWASMNPSIDYLRFTS